MKDIFDERERGFESKFKLDQENRFKVEARRNKKLGLWVAGKLGYDDSAAEAYAREVVRVDLEKAGDADVVEKVLVDLSEADVGVGELEIRRKMVRLAAEAYQEVTGEYPEDLEEACEEEFLKKFI